MTQPVSELKYPYPEELRLFDPDVPHPEDSELKRHLEPARADQPQNISYLPLFSMAIPNGFKKVNYVS
jgi:hypothetical protein